MPIPQTVLDLIQRFEDNLPAYRSAQYNEAQVREEFITPFFAALGWDVYNRQGASEKYKEVVHEAVVRVSGATKAPDYAFHIGGQRVFFVEAKKPAAKTPQSTRLLQQQIDLTDQAIDALVYELYGLTAEEIAIVEGNVTQTSVCLPDKTAN